MQEHDKKVEELFGTNAPSPANRTIKEADKIPDYSAPKWEQSAVSEQDEQSNTEKIKSTEKSKKGAIRKNRDMRVGCLGGLMYFVFVVSVSIILACLAWMAASDVLALNKISHAAIVELSDDIFTAETIQVTDENGNTVNKTITYADIDAVAEILEANHLIEYKQLFKFYCAISNASNKIAAGSYELSTDYDYRALVKKMNQYSGAAVTVEVMFPEGYTMKQIFEKLEENKVASVEDLTEAAKNFSYNYSFLDSNDLGNATRLEGYLFPDTYEFYAYMEPSSAINKFLDNYSRRVTEEMKAKAANMGRSMDEIIIIASLIEKEAGADSERATIASVIYNRLAQGMPLQIDATVLYATGKQEIDQDAGDLEIDSPYNTYKVSGLPAGPISNPGLASIQAALNPEKTGYLFYALDTATGTHRFFKNYNDHQAFVATQNYN